jgi:hypothetical protein
MLHRYWFTFVSIDKASPLNLGCGATAQSASEAEKMIHELVFPLFGERKINDIVEDIDLDALDQNHVIPNIGNTAVKGIWFPAL